MCLGQGSSPLLKKSGRENAQWTAISIRKFHDFPPYSIIFNHLGEKSPLIIFNHFQSFSNHLQSFFMAFLGEKSGSVPEGAIVNHGVFCCSDRHRVSLVVAPAETSSDLRSFGLGSVASQSGFLLWQWKADEFLLEPRWSKLQKQP